MPQQNHDEEASLLQSISRGDRDAFLAIYDRFAGRVYGLTLRILGEAMLAEEVTQDVFVKLWQHAGTYSAKKGSVPAWLLSIARRTAIDRLRYENRRPELAAPDDPQETLDALPHEGQRQEARWRKLRLSFGGLPPEQRIVIELAFYYQMSHSQMADFLELPLGTIKTRLRLGMEKLRKEWDE
jgi:RNA polymerase sigma-70 factor (ECF subfamily)